MTIRYFENHVARFIDACHDRIDFLTEHHYSGEPDTYAASYVVATAYADVKHNRRFPIYNTECNDLTDPATRGDDGMMEAQRKMVDLNRAYYNAADILACARLCPDIARGRAMHALWSGFCRNKGEEDAYAILSTLRGTQLSVTSSDAASVCLT